MGGLVLRAGGLNRGMGWAGKDLEAHPLPPPAMGHLPLDNAAPSSVQHGLGHFQGHIVFTHTEGILSQCWAEQQKCSGGSWRKGRGPEGKSQYWQPQVPVVEGLQSSSKNEYRSQLYRCLFIVEASSTRGQGSNMHLDTSTTEEGTVLALIFLCCFPLLHHPVLLLHEASPCIPMVTQITV